MRTNLIHLTQRPRRNRKTAAVRALIQETTLEPRHLVLPIFIVDGANEKQKIDSMPGVFRLSPDLALNFAKEAFQEGILACILFPVIDSKLKTSDGKEVLNPQGLVPKTIALFKKEIPEMLVMCDVALDPYSSHGHDGLVAEGEILNDETVQILCEQALVQARAGVDIVAPSDMMDGRVAAIRQALDNENFTQVSILSYCAKYASAYYGPFRDALSSAPKFGDKKTYQMDFRNRREALREMQLDESEGADMLMVKPALAYLDIISDLKKNSHLPIAAYQVSGEYSMVMAASEKGWIDAEKIMFENLISIRRAGADFILTYWALPAARLLNK